MFKCVFPNFTALMIDRGLNMEDLTKVLEMTTDTLRMKLSGKRGIGMEEALMLHEKFFSDIPFKILFSKEAYINTSV